MGTYIYTGRNSEGKQVHGTQDAPNQLAAIKTLQSQNLIITRITEAGVQAAAAKAKKTKKHKKAKIEDLLFFCRQTAILLEAGVPLLRSIEILTPQCQSLKLEESLRNLGADIKAGSSLKEATAKNPKIFPSLWPHLIEAGEASGNLPLVLNQLADHLEATLNLKKKVVSALVYPAILVTIAVGAIIIFLVKIIPIFANLFSKFGAKLPVLTQMVIDLSNFLKTNLFLIAMGIGMTVFFTRSYLATAGGKRAADRFVLKIPVMGTMIYDSILARICMNLSTLIQSGVNLLESIQISSHVSGNSQFEDALVAIGNDVQQGKPFSEALDKHNLFSPITIHMVKVGEESGRLAEMLARVGKLYEDRVDVYVSRLSTLIEPLVMVFVGSIIGVLVVAMFMPILNLSSAIH